MIFDFLVFEIAFYLIMDVAVGGTNGWFPDGAGNKSWLDASKGGCFFFRVCAMWKSFMVLTCRLIFSLGLVTFDRCDV